MGCFRELSKITDLASGRTGIRIQVYWLLGFMLLLLYITNQYNFSGLNNTIILQFGSQNSMGWGVWVTPWVACLTLDFDSGHDLTVHGIEPHIGLCTDTAEPAWDSLSPSLSAPPLFSLSLSKRIHKWQKNICVLIRGIYRSVTLCDNNQKRGFADVFKLRVLQ